LEAAVVAVDWYCRRDKAETGVVVSWHRVGDLGNVETVGGDGSVVGMGKVVHSWG
jgi:hypothetical protein